METLTKNRVTQIAPGSTNVDCFPKVYITMALAHLTYFEG